MSKCAELELSLWREAGSEGHWVEARFQRPGEDRVADAADGQIVLDTARLFECKHPQDDAAYGQALAAMLFQPATIRDTYITARDAARSHAPPVPLRLRLRFEAGDDALHALRWELLCDPQSGRFLAPDEHVLLSRSCKPNRAARASARRRPARSCARWRSSPIRPTSASPTAWMGCRCNASARRCARRWGHSWRAWIRHGWVQAAMPNPPWMS